MKELVGSGSELRAALRRMWRKMQQKYQDRFPAWWKVSFPEFDPKIAEERRKRKHLGGTP